MKTLVIDRFGGPENLEIRDLQLGGDFAGVVDAVGAQVRELAPGQAVFGVTQGLGGAHAEFGVTDAGDAESGGVLGKIMLENPFAEDPELARAS